MPVIEHLLIALGDDRDEATYLLEKATALARSTGARLHACRVVHEGIADLPASAIDAAVDLKTLILQAEETVTEEMLEPVRRSGVAVDAVTLWNKRGWEGVCHAAAQAQADMIIRVANLHRRSMEVMRTPDDWNLLRYAEVPVLLVKPSAWVARPVILCALDPFDDAHETLNLALLRHAQGMAQVLGAELDLAVAYPLFERWVGDLGGLRDYEDLKRDVEADILQRVRRMTEDAGVAYKYLLVDEGQPAQVIGALVEDTSAELVVVGSHGRRGVPGMVLGNTSERLVHHLTTDVLTVPLPPPDPNSEQAR